MTEPERHRPRCTCCNRHSMGPLWGKEGNPLVCAICDGGVRLAMVKKPEAGHEDSAPK